MQKLSFGPCTEELHPRAYALWGDGCFRALLSCQHPSLQGACTDADHVERFDRRTTVHSRACDCNSWADWIYHMAVAAL